MKTMNPISVMAVLDEYISSKDFDFRVTFPLHRVQV